MRTARLAIGTALAAALLAGCAGAGHMARATGSEKVRVAKSKAVDSAERAVAKSPRDAALRVALGHAYLDDGRFESAASAFNDALTLGETGGGAVISLALAQIAAGRGGDAVATLDQWREQIPAADLGLALALAGDGARGVAILEDSIRGGENTAKARQNLAYAYALEGRWREARLMAEQDVPANMIDQRIGEWAVQSQPGDFRKRVAALLSVPLRADKGMPEHLALSPVETEQQFAAASADQALVAGELPAASSVAVSAEPDSSAEAAPAELPSDKVDAAPAASASFQTAFAQVVETTQPRFISQPVVQAIAPNYVEAATPRLRKAALLRPVAAADCTHLVQLGSFTSEARARQAWTILTRRNPALRGRTMTITPAIVHGKNYWRVAAGGLDVRGAAGLCSGIKGRGGACFAYAAKRTLPGALPARGSTPAPMLARR
jgi:tetratricopeptide (TPR) repeat protein